MHHFGNMTKRCGLMVTEQINIQVVSGSILELEANYLGWVFHVFPQLLLRILG
jgi:hypothetical protein